MTRCPRCGSALIERERDEDAGRMATCIACGHVTYLDRLDAEAIWRAGLADKRERRAQKRRRA
jgi:DNA-directed RNA polymerase subunit M/transcription elongation factor TFIIS